MLTLGIDTATLEGGVVITENAQLITSATTKAVTMKGHSGGLLSLILESLKKTGVPPDKLDLIAVSTGPGSFTGIRVGLGVALGLADSLGKKAMGVSTLTALARSGAAHDGEYICPVVHSMQNEVYSAIFLMDGGKLKRLTADMALSPSALAGMIDRPTRFIGDGYERNKDLLGSIISSRITFTKPAQAMCAVGVAMEATDMLATGDAIESQILPNYARKPQAEINWENLHNSNTQEVSMMSIEASNQVVNQLLTVNQEFKRLYEEHDDLEGRVVEMRKKKFLTAEDEVELQRLKKTKLAGKDRMLQILEEEGYDA